MVGRSFTVLALPILAGAVLSDTCLSAQEAAEPVGRFNVEYRAYDKTDDAGKSIPADDNARYTARLKEVRARDALKTVDDALEAAERWRASQGFPTSSVGPPTKPNAFVEIYGYSKDPGMCDRGVASFKVGDFRAGGDTIVVSDATILRTSQLDFPAGHELFHSFTFKTWGEIMYEKQFFWITEGTADAYAGFYLENSTGKNIQNTLYSGQSVGVINRNPEYDSSLPGMDEDGSCVGPYQRGHFFYHLGKDSNPSEPWAFLRMIAEEKIDTSKEGLEWLDAVLARTSLKSLWDYYPRFIQNHAASTRYFETKKEEMEETFEPEEPSESLEIPAEIERLSALPYLNKVTFPARSEWRDPPDPDRLYAVVQETIEVERPQAIAQVVDKREPLRREPFRRPVSATSGLSYDWFTRVTNVAPEPWETKDQDVTLRQSLEPVPLAMPDCVTTGGQYEILPTSGMSSIEWEQAFAEGDLRWEVSSGSADGHVLTAPNAPGKVSATLWVKHSKGSAPLRYGDIKVTRSICTVRMTSEGTDFEATFRPGDYTQLRSGNSLMLVKPPYAYFVDDGWKRLNLRDLDRMMGMFGGGGGLFGGMMGNMAGGLSLPTLPIDTQRVAAATGNELAEETAGSAAAISFNLPPVLFKLFDYTYWENASRIEGLGVTRSSVDCLTEEGKCPQIVMQESGESLTVTYDKLRRIVRMQGDGQTHNFEYGDFPMEPIPTRYEELRLGI